MQHAFVMAYVKSTTILLFESNLKMFICFGLTNKWWSECLEGLPCWKKVWHYLSNIRRAKKNINLTQNVMGVARAMLLSSTDLLFVSPPEVRLSVAILIDCW